MPDPLIIVIKGNNTAWRRAIDEAIAYARKLDAASSRSADVQVKESTRVMNAAVGNLDKIADRAARDADRAQARASKLTAARSTLWAKELAADAKRSEKEATQAETDFARKVRQADKAAEAKVRAAEKAAEVEARLNKKILTDEQVNQLARNQVVMRANKARVDAAARLHDVEKSASGGWIQSLTDIHAAVGLIQTGFGGLINLAKAYGDILEKAASRRRELTKGFTDERDRLRGLATVMDTIADTDFTRKHVAFQAETGMKPEEAIGFREEFQNTGAQYAGRTIDKGEYQQYETQLAQLAMAKGLPPEQAGEMGGRVLGMKDRKAMGKDASEDALGDVNAAISIMSHGNGRPGVLMTQFSEVAAASQNEDEMKGTFQNSKDVAIATSIAAEKHDAEAANLIRAANRGIRGFDDKHAGPLLERAKVDRDTPFLDAMKKIAPVVEAEAKAGPAGTKTEDVLRKYFPETRTREAMNVFLNKGVGGGLIDERREYSKQFEGPGPALAAITKAEANPDQGIQLRKAEAAKHQAEMTNGQREARLATLRSQAETAIEEQERNGTEGGLMEDAAIRLGTFGMGYPHRIKVDREMARIVADRGARVGVQFPQEPIPPWMPEPATNYVQSMIDKVETAGGDPYTDRGPGGSAATANLGSTMLPLLEGMLGELKKLNVKPNPQRPLAPPLRVPLPGDLSGRS